MSARRFGLLLLVALGASVALWAGGRPGDGAPDRVWGVHGGALPGEIHRPRAVAVDPEGRVFLVDFTARIQAFTSAGQFLGISFTTPDFRDGRPSGLSIDRDGNLIVADSHYHCVRIYRHDGTLLKTLGGTPGTDPGEWGYVSDCVQDSDGYYYISEFGLNDRVTKLDPAGNFLKCWGKNGQAEGDFNRVRALAIGPDGLLYCADACNHRVQVFTREGEFVRAFGSPGAALGELSLPYDLAFLPDGNLVVVERGNRRVTKFTRDGVALATWGRPGSNPGELADPWAVAVDRQGRVLVVDTENHRVQRFEF